MEQSRIEERQNDRSTDSKSWTASASEQVERSANVFADEVKGRARDIAEQQKRSGAEQIDGVADAMKEAADHLEDKVPLAAEYIDEVAGHLGSVASTHLVPEDEEKTATLPLD